MDDIKVGFAIACWDSVSEYLVSKEKEVAAELFINTLIDFDFSEEELATVAESSHLLSDAIFAMCEEENLIEDDTDENED